jgi:arsenate reductase-like glutaredoxin family protein
MKLEFDLETVNGNNIRSLYNFSQNDDAQSIANSLKLTEKLWNYKNKMYKVIKYDKENISNDMIKTTGLFRSVIVDDTNRIVVFSPPKSLNSDTFMRENQDISKVTAEEYVEGTMINLFWNDSDWEIATRSTVGGEIIFFQCEDNVVTFRRMFLDICNEVNLDFDNLNKNHIYSFVMQHPSNRIVKPITEKMLYLVKVYSLNENNKFKVIELNIEEIYKQYFSHTTNVVIPEKYQFTSYEELFQKYASMNTSYDCVGVMLHSENGDRSKLRNPNYEYVKKLRGNQPKLQYEYLSLRKTGRMTEFLNFYPEYKKQFYVYRKQLHDFTLALYQNYVNCYINKERPLGEFPKEYRISMYNIHQYYLTYLREEKKHITFKTVVEYVNSLHQSQQMHLLNYNIKRQFIDIAKADADKLEV